jgi:hypothetical protein
MTYTDTITLISAAVVAYSLMLSIKGERIPHFLIGLLIAAPFGYMATHQVPTMTTVLGQWALAITIIGGSPLTGIIAGTRGLVRRLAA